jgi:hypothetical protein
MQYVEYICIPDRGGRFCYASLLRDARGFLCAGPKLKMCLFADDGVLKPFGSKDLHKLGVGDGITPLTGLQVDYRTETIWAASRSPHDGCYGASYRVNCCCQSNLHFASSNYSGY